MGIGNCDADLSHFCLAILLYLHPLPAENLSCVEGCHPKCDNLCLSILRTTKQESNIYPDTIYFPRPPPTRLSFEIFSFELRRSLPPLLTSTNQRSPNFCVVSLKSLPLATQGSHCLHNCQT